MLLTKIIYLELVFAGQSFNLEFAGNSILLIDATLNVSVQLTVMLCDQNSGFSLKWNSCDKSQTPHTFPLAAKHTRQEGVVCTLWQGTLECVNSAWAEAADSLICLRFGEALSTHACHHHWAAMATLTLATLIVCHIQCEAAWQALLSPLWIVEDDVGQHPEELLVANLPHSMQNEQCSWATEWRWVGIYTNLHR